MNHKKKIFNWKPLSEYNGGRVLATNGLDIIIGRIDYDNDCIKKCRLADSSLYFICQEEQGSIFRF